MRGIHLYATLDDGESTLDLFLTSEKMVLSDLGYVDIGSLDELQMMMRQYPRRPAKVVSITKLTMKVTFPKCKYPGLNPIQVAVSIGNGPVIARMGDAICVEFVQNPLQKLFSNQKFRKDFFGSKPFSGSGSGERLVELAGLEIMKFEITGKATVEYVFQNSVVPVEVGFKVVDEIDMYSADLT